MIKFGTQLGATGKRDLRENLQSSREMGCEGLEVSINVGGLRTGAVKMDDLLSQATAMRDAFDVSSGRLTHATRILPPRSRRWRTRWCGWS